MCKKGSRILVSVLLSVTLLIGVPMFSGTALAEPRIYGDFKYDNYGLNGTLKILDYLGDDDYVTVPAEIEGIPVTLIGYKAFEDCTMRSVTLPNSIAEIDDWAFNRCHNLSSIKFPAGITYIGFYAFGSCYSLQKAIFLGDKPSFGQYGAVFPGAHASFKMYYPVGRSSSWAAYEGYTTQPYCIRIINLQDGSAAAKAMVDVVNGRVPEPKAPTRAGFLFAGWYKDAACTRRWNFSEAVTVTNITLFARWVRPDATFTVTFNSQGGSRVDAKTVRYNSTVAKPANPTRTGYVFGGWYKEAACVNAWSFSTRITQNVTLFAKWTANRYAISVVSNNTGYGTVTGGGSYAYGTSATVKATPKAGCRFVRWLEGSAAVSVSAQYPFTVTRARTLRAEFAKIGTPGSLKAVSAGYNGIRVSWAAVPGVKEYEVYRAASSGGTYVRIATTATASCTNTGLTTGAAYYYRVRAKCVAGSTTTYGGFSVAISAKPVPAMPVVKAARASATSIKVSWGAVAGAGGYEVYRAVSAGGAYTKVKMTAWLSYTNTGLSTGKTYYFKVRAYRTVSGVKVYGGYSAVVSAKP